MIVAKINVTRILKGHLFAGKAGKYLDIALIENKDGTDQYGNDGFIAQSVGKEARERGEKGPIIGNWRVVKAKRDDPARAPKPKHSSSESTPAMDDDVMF